MKDLLENIKQNLKPESYTPDLYHTIKENTDRPVVLGGSFAKGTHIRDDFDIDIYVKFDKPPYTDKLRDILDKIDCTYEEIPGSRNYFKVHREKEYEIVPIKDINQREHAETVIDMSVFHISYFNTKADKTPELRDEVRLLKQFMKANRLYGSESYIQGFSGHVVDLLIIHYGSFKQTLEHAKDWDDETIIDVDDKQDYPKLSINTSKLQSPLIIVDPTDPYRNASAALSKEKYTKFKKLSKEFLNNPSKKFFHKKPFTKIIEEHKKPDHKLLILKANPLEGKDDVVACNIKQIKEHLTKNLKTHDFPITWSDWEYNTPSTIAIQTKNIPEETEHQGPPSTMKEHVKKFKQKHDTTYEKNGTIYTTITRDYTKPETLINQLLDEEKIQTKCQSITLTKIL